MSEEHGQVHPQPVAPATRRIQRRGAALPRLLAEGARRAEAANA